MVLTFDDGYRNFLTTVAPIFAGERNSGDSFLITDKAVDAPLNSSGHGWMPNDDHSYLSWAEARMLQNDYGVQIGSHTCPHCSLTTLKWEDVRRELEHSYCVVAQKLGVDTVPLAYPKGKSSDLIAKMTREAGYACGLTTHGGVNSVDHDLFALRRVLIGDDDDIASFAVGVSGLRWWLVQGTRLLLSFRRNRLNAPAPSKVLSRGLNPSVESLTPSVRNPSIRRFEIGQRRWRGVNLLVGATDIFRKDLPESQFAYNLVQGMFMCGPLRLMQ